MFLKLVLQRFVRQRNPAQDMCGERFFLSKLLCRKGVPSCSSQYRTTDHARHSAAIRQSRSIMGFRCRICFAGVSPYALGCLSVYKTLAYYPQAWFQGACRSSMLSITNPLSTPSEEASSSRWLNLGQSDRVWHIGWSRNVRSHQKRSMGSYLFGHLYMNLSSNARSISPSLGLIRDHDNGSSYDQHLLHWSHLEARKASSYPC